MKGFTGTVAPYPYFNAKTDAEAVEAALILRRGLFFSDFILGNMELSSQNGGMIEYGIFGEGSQISINQRRESTVFSFLIGRNLGLFPENTVLY